MTLDDSVFKGDKQTLDVDKEIERYDYEEFEEGYRQEDEEEVEEVIERILPISLDRKYLLSWESTCVASLGNLAMLQRF